MEVGEKEVRFQDRQYTEQANSISENAIEQAASIYNRLLDYFSGLIEGSESFGEAQRITSRYAADREFINAFQSKLFDGMVTEDALARSYLVDKDRVESMAARKVAAKLVVDGIELNGAGWFAFKDDRIRISFDLVPEAAARYMRERSFWITGVENDVVLKKVQKALEESIAKGETCEDFRRKANQIFDEMKVTRLAPHRLQNVFRTNLFGSYAKAQIEQLQTMQDRFPLWRYVAILDRATRPQHAAWNGTIWRIGEGPYPPLKNGEDGGIAFNCRCTAQHLHVYEAERLEADKSLKIESGTPYSLQQILSEERAAYEEYLAGVQASLNPEIRAEILRNL